MNCVPEGDITNYNTHTLVAGVETRIKKRPSAPLSELHLRSKKEGGWVPVYQQITGITTVSKYVIA